MAQRSNALCFTLKTCPAFWVGGGRFWENLDCNDTVQPGIPRAIHLPHAAPAEERVDAVAAQTGATDESRSCKEIREGGRVRDELQQLLAERGVVVPFTNVTLALRRGQAGYDRQQILHRRPGSSVHGPRGSCRSLCYIL